MCETWAWKAKEQLEPEGGEWKANNRIFCACLCQSLDREDCGGHGMSGRLSWQEKAGGLRWREMANRHAG